MKVFCGATWPRRTGIMWSDRKSYIDIRRHPLLAISAIICEHRRSERCALVSESEAGHVLCYLPPSANQHQPAAASNTKAAAHSERELKWIGGGCPWNNNTALRLWQYNNTELSRKPTLADSLARKVWMNNKTVISNSNYPIIPYGPRANTISHVQTNYTNYLYRLHHGKRPPASPLIACISGYLYTNISLFCSDIFHFVHLCMCIDFCVFYLSINSRSRKQRS